VTGRREGKDKNRNTHCQDKPSVSSESPHLDLGVLRLAPVEHSFLLIMNGVIPSWIPTGGTCARWSMIFFELKYDIFGNPISVGKNPNVWIGMDVKEGEQASLSG